MALLNDSPQSNPKKPSTNGAADRPWHMRAWSGITTRAYVSALVKHRFAVSPTRWPMATILSGLSVFHSSLAILQSMIYGRKIKRTELVDAPIFVLGHWRSGTTLLHELIVRDPDHTYPSTFACFSPNDFLVAERWLKWAASWFLPKQRPMDNMAIGWDLPQEDEWALCNMGVPSPYLKIMFPNQPVRDSEYFDLRELSAQDRQHWQQQLTWLLKCLTVRDPKRIVLKTPLHTARVRALIDAFPDARFVHVTRDPFEIFPSTVHTWKRMYRYHGLQVPEFGELEDSVLDTFCQMYRVFDEDLPLIRAGRFCQIRYEDLAVDPVGQMQQIYDNLGLEITDQTRAGWEAYAERASGYRTNRYELTDGQREQISRRWGGYIEKYGYSANTSPQ